MLAGGMALLGRQTVPFDRLNVVPQDTLAAEVHEAEVVLSPGVALLGSKPEPRGRLTEGFDTPDLKDAKALLEELK